ncbi:MAG: hypothetical protein WBC33_01050, partial [Conexibacter sp.]
MATTRKRTPAKSRSRSQAKARPRARRASGSRMRLPRPHALQLTPHQLDVLGLALVACGIFLAFVMYLGSAGGSAGDAAQDGLRLLLGQVASVVP